MNTNRFLLFLLLFFCFAKYYSQKKDSVPHQNIGILGGCSVLEGKGIRAQFPAFFYSSKRHGFSVALAGKFNSDVPFALGVNAGYFLFIEPSFRDITFFINYNATYYFETNSPITHILGIGTQIDFGKRGFIQHSVGLGLQQSSVDFSSLGACGQLKLSIGFYIREIPVVHIHDDWEK